ncbi:MAG: TOBE domain-containing protein, partial [Chloroflexota bacterium]|nr:TOBE domain-containing protein [Chloroflexota bacterium]
GSPRMNFMPVKVQGGTTAVASGFTLDLPKAVGIENAILGIRPDDLNEHGQGNGAAVNLKVDVVEILGSDQYLYGKIGADDVIARVDPELKVSTGDQVPLVMNSRRMHLFDAETEKALL